MNLSSIKKVIPDEYENFELDQMIGDPNVIEPIKIILKDYLKNLFTNEKNGAGLLLYGRSSGNGKTYSAYHILNKVREARIKWDRIEKKEGFGYTKIVSILCFDYLKAASNYETRFVDLVEEVKTCPFLLLDDLSSDSFKGNLALPQAELFSLVDYRVSFNLPTIYTSNCNTLEELQKLVSSKLFSRITYKATPINFTGPDVRPLITEQFKEELLQGE